MGRKSVSTGEVGAEGIPRSPCGPVSCSQFITPIGGSRKSVSGIAGVRRRGGQDENPDSIYSSRPTIRRNPGCECADGGTPTSGRLGVDVDSRWSSDRKCVMACPQDGEDRDGVLERCRSTNIVASPATIPSKLWSEAPATPRIARSVGTSKSRSSSASRPRSDRDRDPSRSPQCPPAVVADSRSVGPDVARWNERPATVPPEDSIWR
jgi:hypothetical protein